MKAGHILRPLCELEENMNIFPQKNCVFLLGRMTFKMVVNREKLQAFTESTVSDCNVVMLQNDHLNVDAGFVSTTVYMTVLLKRWSTNNALIDMWMIVLNFGSKTLPLKKNFGCRKTAINRTFA